ncbi:MAG: glycine cleavage system aminomethyltransferase GcvT [Armatimonadetes bacterium]|nr:glycine cleavage system aminomethyltransferase GcvT [Armatimonadota bacterium]
MSEPELLRTPLYEAHVAAGARIVPFAGWEMPVQYSGVIDEVKAVRHNAGLFDVSHMGELHVTGPAALAWLNSMTTNDVARLRPGRAQYSLLLDEEACILDDILVYCSDEEHYMVVANAGNTDRVRDWLGGRIVPGVEVEDASLVTALIALQGPEAEAVLQPLCNGLLSELKRFGFASGMVAGLPCVISRTGYTGEDGFELFTQEDVSALWQAILTAGDGRVKPCGLGARDVLRIEAGNVLYGHEIWEEVNPLSAGLMWTVKLDKGEFVGKAPLQQYIQSGAALVLAGFTANTRAIPRQNYPIRRGSEEVGFVTSGTLSPTLNRPIAMGYVPPECAEPGTEVAFVVRDRPEPMTVTPLPFYRGQRR